MLYFICIWNILTAGCWLIGMGVLPLLSRDFFHRQGDRLVLGLWLGLVIFALSLMIISFVLPLSLGLSAITLVLLGGACLFGASARHEFRTVLSSFNTARGLSVLALEVGVAALVNRPIIWFDTGSYHLGLMRWLNQFGVVPGVALIHGSFGFTSAWFSFSAPFTSDIWGDQIGAVTNGFIFLLATVSVMVLAHQSCRQSAQLSDYFGICFFSVTAIAYGVTVFTGAPILVSFSPDVAITFLVGVVAWLMLVLSQQSNPPGAWSANTSTPCKIRGLVPFFAAGAFSIKLSAIPTAAIALLFYARPYERFSLRRLCLGLLIFGIVIIPMLIFGIITSGCPLYPTRLFCLNLPWTLSAAQSATALQPIAVLKGEDRLPNLLEIQDWIWLLTKRAQLFLISSETRGMVVLGAISVLIFGFGLIQLKRQHQPGQIWVLGLGVVGSLFILSTSPLIRFGLGYFSLIPALMMAMVLMRFKPNVVFWSQSLSERTASDRSKVFFWLFLLGWSGSLMLSAGVQARLLYPPTLPSAKIVSAKINDVVYRYPKNFQLRCWNTPIPCAPLPIEENITFRKPDLGLRGGFQRLNTTASDP